MTAALSAMRRSDVAELMPVLRRALQLDPASLVRLRSDGPTWQVLVRLPFDVLVARAVTGRPPAPHSAGATPAAVVDLTSRAQDVLAWFEDETLDALPTRDHEWRGGVPPRDGWRRVDTVPDEVVRSLVRTGALALRSASERGGGPGVQARAAAADALLDSVVLTVTGEVQPDPAVGSPDRALITLRMLSALTRMGFVPRDSHVAVDLAARWTRVAAGYGSVYAERPGVGLSVLRR